MKKLITFCLSMIGALSLFAGAASAHVTVQPSETSQGKYEVFTIKVPSESDTVPTTKIEVKIPGDVNISRVEPKPGWKYEVQKDETGKITSITWAAEDEGLLPIEFGMFNISGKVGDDAKEIVWKAYQTYKDGSIVEWVGAEGSEKPASVTAVKSTNASSTHGNVDSTKEHIPLYLSIAALIVSLISLFFSIKKRG